MSLRRTSIFVAAAALWSVPVAHAELSNDWLLVPGMRAGPITATTTFKDLQRQFGKKNVTKRKVYVGEGMGELGAVLFADDPTQKLEISWRKGGETAGVDFVQLSGGSSKWTTDRRIALGTTLEKLESLNGKPFKLAGFGWDYGGTVMSWEGGKLSGPSDQHLIVRLQKTANEEEPAVASASKQVMGDKSFSSDFPAMRGVKPAVQQLRVTLTKATTESGR